MQKYLTCAFKVQRPNLLPYITHAYIGGALGWDPLQSIYLQRKKEEIQIKILLIKLLNKGINLLRLVESAVEGC